MPIPNQDLGNYSRPDVYIVEKDMSIIQLPIQDVLINLVPGFSKKGPFNVPVRVNNPFDFEKIFGPVDKNLENKGSFFHRTVEDMLNTGPVWALNLLKTDPNRDILEYESFSVSAQYDNGQKDTAPYERFFNRQDFWERSSESFLDIVKEKYDVNSTKPDPTKNLLNFTNMGDKQITLFIYKSQIQDTFDITAEEWYGSADKVPPYIFPKDWISDYMVTVLIITGDWSDYKYLSNDVYWSKYFNTKGLIKSQISNFLNDSLVNVINYYDVSLIPYFKDVTGKDMEIETVINWDTDKTGLFCSYNKEVLLEYDYYKGNIDIVGQTLVGNSKKSVDFISYKGNISEQIEFGEMLLDSPTNSFGNYSSDMNIPILTGYTQRTANYTNLYTNISSSGSTNSSSALILDVSGEIITLDFSTGITYNIWQDTGVTFGYTGWTWQDFVSGTTIPNTWQDTGLTEAVNNLEVGDMIYFNQSFDGIEEGKTYYVVEINGGSIKISDTPTGQPLTISSSGTTAVSAYWLKTSLVDNSTSGDFTYVLYDTIYTLESTKVYAEKFSINDYTQTYSRYDILYLSSGSTTAHFITGDQYVGTSPSKPEFKLSTDENIILGYYKHIYYGSAISDVTILSSYIGVTTTSSYLPLLTTNGDISRSSGSTTTYNYLDITFTGTKLPIDYTNYNQLRKTKLFTDIYTNIILNKGVIINVNNGDKYDIKDPTIYAPTLTGDARIRIYFSLTTNPFDYMRTDGVFLIYYIDKEFVMDPINNVNTLKTTEHSLEYYTGSGTGIVAKWSSMYLAYYNGNINNGDYFWYGNITGSTSYKIYLHFSLDLDDNLTIEFQDEYGSTVNINLWDGNYDKKLIIYSDVENWKQTIDIENTSDIIDFQNTYHIYVDKKRYNEIERGMYLESYYDTTYYDDPFGEGYLLGILPRKMVRIIDIKNDTVNTNWKILYTDGPIKINSNYQTISYSTIDNYFNEYNGLMLKPFVVDYDSMPNNTDTRQMEILSVLDKITNLAKGLSNKNRISWRYLVDSFGLGLTNKSKQQFVDLCGTKLNCFGFINMPSVRQLKTSTNPSFINSDRTLNTEYLKKGGNAKLNPSFLYSFGTGVGRSTVGYFFPYVKDVSDNTKFIPPAAKAAKAYMNKFITSAGGIYPWTIVAGSIMGSLPDVTAIEVKFTDDDLSNLNKMGCNAVNYTSDQKFYINTENTAQVFPYTSLSIIHSREVLIELENKLYDMLLNYQWKFNTEDIRNEIISRADYICEYFKNNYALYDFKNVMDETNNTDYIIDIQMGVLDTYVEVIKGMGVIVNNITILKKGSIQSGGFIPSVKAKI